MLEGKWYRDSFRRNLVDMHIDDWDDRFLSQFDPQEYYDNLKKANIRSAMIYLHSHVGYSYYPTRVGKMHSAFRGREDSMRRLVDLCHKGGIDVIGYYSLVFNTFEEDRHPEWRIIDADDGSSERQRGGRYGHCCPNNKEYRDYIDAQIKEISEYFRVDGMFYDMTYWHGICRCPSCRERYFLEESRELPTSVDLTNDEFKRFVHKRYEWIGEFANFVTETSKKYMPHATVEHNYAYAAAGDWNQAVTERTAEACDYCGGDPGKDKFSQSFTIKYFRAASKSQPCEYMIYRCSPNLSQHTVTKSPEQLELEVFLTASHHAAAFIIDAMDPVGTLNSKVYSMIGDIFGRLVPYEPYLTSGEPIEDVGVYYSSSGRYNSLGENYNSLDCSTALTATLVKYNIPVGIITSAHQRISSKYKMVFAPAIAGLEQRDKDKLTEYVREGGVLYFSGFEEPELLMELVGIEICGYTDHAHTYYAPTKEYEALFDRNFDYKYPLALSWRMPFTKLNKKAQVMAKLSLPYGDPSNPLMYSSIHSNPPAEPTEHPMLLSCEYGKGKVIWSAAPIEKDDRLPYVNLIMRILREYLPKEVQSIASDAPKQVEIFSSSCLVRTVRYL